VTNRTPSLRRRRDLSGFIGDGLSIYNSPLLPQLLVLALPTAAVGLLTLVISQTTPPLVTGIFTLPLSVAVGAILGTGGIYFLDQHDRGNPVTVSEALLVAWSRAGSLIGAAVRSTVLICLNFITIVLIPRAFIKLVQWTFIHEAIMVDDQRGEPSLGYSANLVSGRGWPTFWAILVIGIVAGAIGGAGRLVLSGLLGPWVGGVFGVAVGLIAFPFSITAHLLVYYDLKMRKALEVTGPL